MIRDCSGCKIHVFRSMYQVAHGHPVLPIRKDPVGTMIQPAQPSK